MPLSSDCNSRPTVQEVSFGENAYRRVELSPSTRARRDGEGEEQKEQQTCVLRRHFQYTESFKRKMWRKKWPGEALYAFLTSYFFFSFGYLEIGLNLGGEK